MAWVCDLMMIAQPNNNIHHDDNDSTCFENIATHSDKNSNVCSAKMLHALMTVLNKNMPNNNDDARSENNINAHSDDGVNTWSNANNYNENDNDNGNVFLL